MKVAALRTNRMFPLRLVGRTCETKLIRDRNETGSRADLRAGRGVALRPD
jgi:hypothetical protein